MKHRCFLYGAPLAVLGLSAWLPAQGGFVLNPSFESNYPETWPHYGAADNWNGVGGVNLSDGPFHNAGTPIPDGTHVGFKQGSGDFSQDITGLEAGKRYWIQFYYDARGCCGGSIDLLTKINETELDKIANVQPATGGAPYYFRSVPFVAESDSATLVFTAVASGDATVLLDAVTIVQRDATDLVVANPSFEASGDVLEGDGLLTPNGLAGWTAEGQYGVNTSGVGPIADNGTAPDQDHVAFLLGPGSIRQSVRVVAGKTYQLSLAYNARSGTSPHLQIKVGGTVLFEEDVSPVGGASAYRQRTVSFTSTDVTAQIEIAQSKAGDHALLIDNVRLVGEVPAASEPVGLSPDVAELGIGEEVDVVVSAPADAIAVKDVRILVQSSSAATARFVDASGALIPRVEVLFTRGGTTQKSVKLRGLARGSGNIQVADAGGLPIRNQITLTVVAAPLKNPSFESTAAPSGVGYGPIIGWTGGANTGINAAGQPFADNGLIPDRKQVALVQGNSFLNQTVRGLIPGKTYWLQFFYNIRNCCPAGESTMDLTVALGGKDLATITGIGAVGEGLPYHFRHVEFVAESASALLEFKATPNGDATLLLDGVTIVQRDPGQVVVRNPSFEASGSVFPFPGYFDAVAGWEVSGGNRGVNIDGVGPFTDNGRAQAGDLVLFMQSNGSSVSQNLTGLTDGRRYIVGFLMNARSCCGPEDSSILVSYADSAILEESFQPVGAANPYYVRQATFTAAGTEGVLKFQGTSPEGDHTVLVDNVVVLPESGAGSAPFILAQPVSVTAPVGGTVTLAAAAVGAGNLTYQWKKGGQNLAGRNEPALVLENVSADMAGSYTVEVRGSGGVTTSIEAAVRVLEAIPGLYDTGVGPDRVALADGAVDPHYTLVTNPDNAQSTTVFVQDGSKWPIVEGPWVANSDLSKWVGPRVDPGTETPLSGPAAGNYLYRQTVDLTGFDPATVVLSGTWGADNAVELVVNGVATGVTQSGFATLAAFSANRVFKSGVNEIGFRVNNGDAGGGPSGLRVEGLTALGVRGGGTIESPTLTISRSGVNLRISWPASATDALLQSTAALPSGWADDPSPVISEGNDKVVAINPSGTAKFYRLIIRR